MNTPFALVKTRPLKNAIKESKLKADTIAPLPATRPKTCTSMARRLVSSALGLKMNVSQDLLSAERTILENAKGKSILIFYNVVYIVKILLLLYVKNLLNIIILLYYN